MQHQHIVDDLIREIHTRKDLPEGAKTELLRNVARLRDTRVNILVTGATGSGKSSTINALFNTQKARVGQGVDPETMDIVRYEFDNIVLFDSPGLGDGKEADLRHAKNITAKLREKDADGNLLVDLVLVVLDGSSRDLGTSFELINQVIIPSLGDDKSRLLVAINQADMAMKGRHWNHGENQPDPTLAAFLEEKVASTKRRIREATGVDVEPIYYAAGYKDGGQVQNPYNLAKLLVWMLRHTKQEKRVAFAQDINKDSRMWQDDDRRADYRAEISASLVESVIVGATLGGTLGTTLGGMIGGPAGAAVGRAIGTVVGGGIALVRSLFG